MTVSSPTNRVLSYGNGVATVWPFTFSIISASDLVVIITDLAGTATTLLATQYSLTGIGSDSGGTVTYPLSGAPLAAGWSILLKRVVPYTQTSDIQNQGGFFPDVIERALDRIVFQIQQIAEVAGRGLLFPDSETGLTIPSLINRAGKFLGFDAGGLPVALSGTGADAALRTDLAASGSGASLVSFLQSGAGAIARSVRDKLRKDVFRTPQDFGALGNGATDDTAAFNLATQSAAAWSTGLYYGVQVPGGFYKIGADNSGITVRKGQSLIGAGFGATTIDVSATGANTVPTVRGEGGDVGSGYPVEAANLLFLGGPSGKANIEMTGFAGWKVRDVFFSAPGIGVLAGGGDGQVQNCIFDLGLNHIVVTGGNLMISGNIHYLGSYHVTLATACYDTTITNGQYEYFEYAAILVSGGVGPKNVAIDNSNFLQNGQYVTTQGGVFIISNNCDISLSNNRFHNINGYAIKYGNGIGNRMLVNGFVIDQEKTLPLYDQGVSMGGIDCTNMDATIRNGVIRNMQLNSILIGGAEIVNVIIDAVRFENCVGGAADIVITNSNAASRVFIKNCHSSRALVSVTGAAVVNVSNCTDTTSNILASVAALSIPKTRDTFFVTGTTNITSIVSDAGNSGRTIRLIFQGALTLSNTGVSTFLAGGSNFVTTANDVLTLTTNDGTAWFETSRSLN